MDPTPLQSVGEETSALLVFAGRALAFLLAVWIAHRAYSGYQDSRAPALFWLALGITLLAVVPTAARFLLPTFGTSPLTTTLLATGSEIAGLAAILYTVYGRP